MPHVCLAPGHLLAACTAALVLCLLSASSAAAADFRVGASFPGNGCTHGTLGSAIAAAAATPEEDTIRLSNNMSYFIQHHTLTSFPDTAPLTILGGFDDCSDPDPDITSPTVLTNGSGGASVFVITGGSSVFLFNLAVTAVSDYAVRVEGGAQALLALVTLSLSRGGLLVDGADAELAGVTIQGNNVTSTGAEGGGVRCVTGSLTLQDVTIEGNVTASDGGGMALTECPTSFAGTVIIRDNEALRGGGLFIDGTTVGGATRGAGPSTGNTLIANNDALADGGGIFLDVAGLYDVPNTRLIGNVAIGNGGGAAVFGGSTLNLQADFSTCSRTDSFADTRCTEVSLNNTRGDFGSALSIESSTVSMTSGAIFGNTDDLERAYTVWLSNSTGTFESVEAHGNRGPVVFEIAGGSNATLAFLSLARNFDEFGGPAIAVEANAATASVYSSAFADINGFTTIGTGAFTAADCLLANTLVGVNPSRSAVGDPLFGAPDQGDLSLAPHSPAVDFCDTTAYAPAFPDIDGEARANDYAANPNGSPGVGGGTVDLGANEEWWVFVDGFESGDLSAWTASSP